MSLGAPQGCGPIPKAHVTYIFGKGASAQPFGLALGHLRCHVTSFWSTRPTLGDIFELLLHKVGFDHIIWFFN